MLAITEDEALELLGVIDGLIGMMEPYYSQNNGADDALELMERMSLRLPYKEDVQAGDAICPECGKSFVLRYDGGPNIAGLQHHMFQTHADKWTNSQAKEYCRKLRPYVRRWKTKAEYLEAQKDK